MIDQLLKEVGEDKCDNLATTSLKFKKDLWKFFFEGTFQGPSWRSDNPSPLEGFLNEKVVVEFGTHKGQTTRILAHLFDKVYTINQNNNAAAKEFNKDLNNIVYIDNFNLYSGAPLPIPSSEPIFACLIDAGHNIDQVLSDINKCFTELTLEETSFIVFDDYGLEQYKNDVKAAVDLAISSGALAVTKEIGHSAGHNFGGTPPRVLSGPEGLICRVKFHNS